MSETRDIGFLKWSDSLAWMEPMKGERWKTTLRSEERRFDKACNDLAISSEMEKIIKELQRATSLEKPESSHFGKIEFSIISQRSISWKTDTSNLRSAIDIAMDVKGNVWDIVDSGNGAEVYEVSYWKYGVHTPVWSYKGVSPSILVLYGRCYFIEAKNSLWYYRLVSVNATTGKDYKIVYEETNPRWNLTLVRGESQTGYMVRENSGLQETFQIERSSLKSIGGQGFFVLGKGRNFLATLGRGTDGWQGHGTLSKWILPKGTPESVCVNEGLLVTRSYGERSLWKCSTHEPKLLIKGLCQIRFNDLLGHHGILAPLQFTVPGTGHLSVAIEKEKVSIPFIPSYASASRRFTHGHVPYVLVQRTTVCRGLLVVGYGAYGMNTQLNTSRWYPLLMRGWTIVFALIRGGGDHTLAWADAARTWKREQALNDFEEVIRDAQAFTGISPKKTVVYGRSAGGLLIGSIAAKYGSKLFGTVYGEVPYLDILRTTTNPALPLTQLEYEEFGNPAEKLIDLATLVRISPVDRIPERGLSSLRVLLRTGENDRQVLAYEPVKWITKARAGREDGEKLLAYKEKEGHFVSGDSLIQERATDLAILLAWINKM